MSIYEVEPTSHHVLDGRSETRNERAPPQAGVLVEPAPARKRGTAVPFRPRRRREHSKRKGTNKGRSVVSTRTSNEQEKTKKEWLVI